MTTKFLPRIVQRLLDVRSIAATFCALFGSVGVVISVHLTRIKFQMDYTPCLSEHGHCQVGSMSCDAALSSAWSTLFGLPFSVWGGGFYVALVVAAAVVLRRSAFGGTAANCLVLMATFAVLVSAALAGYTAVVLESPCPFCISLYAVSVMCLGSALLAWRPPDQQRVSFREVIHERLADALDCAFLLAMVLTSAVGLQAVGYHAYRNFVDAQEGCPEPVKELPETSIRAGTDAPQVILALFVDMTCPKCLGEFKRLGKALLAEEFPAPVQIWVYHMPRHACDSTAFPAGFDKTDEAARFNGACLAARAAECTEKLAGKGFEMIDGMFALHNEREEGAPMFTIANISNRAVEVGLDIDPDDPGNLLLDCINHDTTVLARITEHQRYTDQPGFLPPTVLIYHAEAGVPDMRRKPFVANASTSIKTVLEYVRVQADAAL